ncbi:MAG: serine hydrolase [Acidobacteria bacterium]|nr:serine hydrolase [Acidobacteriota bacterium]
MGIVRRSAMAIPVLLALVLFGARPAAAQCAYPTPVTPATCEAAKQYNASTGGVSLLVWVNGQVVCEDYNSGSGPNVAHELWSCTKSFSGAMAAAAIDDGLISSWDERLVETIPEWRGDPRKSQVTLRQLLSLTSGIQAEVSGMPTYAEAILVPATHDPGTYWEYGSVPYQIFGEFMRRKLAPNYVDPLAYMQARFFAPIGAQYSGWTRGTDNMPHLPWGSQWTPREWINYGELVRLGGWWPPLQQQLIAQESLDAAFHRSPVNAEYGLTWWLPVPGNVRIPCDAVMAVGLGTQELYVIRSLKLVAARQTDAPWDGLNYSHEEFLDRLLAPANPQDDCPPAEVQELRLARSGVDLLFDWAAVNRDATGNSELVGGYDLWSATEPDFSDPLPLGETMGPVSASIAPGAAGAADAIVYYQVRARDKCGNDGP